MTKVRTIAALWTALLLACGGGEESELLDDRDRDPTDFDRGPPTVTITNPAAGAILPLEPITVTGIASDDQQLERVEIQVDDGPFESAAGLDNWSFVTEVLTEGSHTVTARAIDRAGKNGERSLTVEVAGDGGVDAIDPTVQVLEPSDGAVIGAGPFTVRGTASDDVALAAVSVGLNLSGQTIANGTERWSIELDASGLAAGDHNVLVTATDTSGNRSPATILTITVDRDVPQAVVRGAVSPLSTRRSATFSVSGANVATYAYSLDESPLSGAVGVDTPLTVSDLEEGNHRIDVFGLDSVGVQQQTPTSFTWTIDSTPPEATLDGIPTEPTAEATRSFTVEGADYYRYRIDGGAYGDRVAASTPIDTGALADGVHRIEVKGSDALGNEQVEPTVAEWQIDTTPPGKPILSGVPPDQTPLDGVVIGVSGPDVAGYRFSFGGGAEQGPFLSGEPITLSSLALGSGYTLAITPLDAVGNAGAPVVVQWDVVTATVPLLYAVPPSIVGGPLLDYEVDGLGFSSFEWRVVSPGGSMGTWTPASFGELNIDLGTLSAGLYGVQFRDGTDSAAPISTHAVEVDLTPPVAVLSNTPARPTNRTDIRVWVGGAGVVEYQHSVDGESFSAPQLVSQPIERAGFVPGLHTLDVLGIDAAGNVQDVATGIDWTVNVSGPVANLTGVPPAQTTATSVTLNVGGVSVEIYRYRLDGGAISEPRPVSESISLSGLSPGPHTVEVLPESAVGNLGAIAEVSWTITE